MSKKEDFKNFILNKPELIDYVENNNITWQKLFEIYDLYGENTNIWNKYITSKPISNTTNIRSIINTLKSINLDTLEDNIKEVQKIVDLISEFTKKDEDVKKIESKEEKIDKIYGDDNEN